MTETAPLSGAQAGVTAASLKESAKQTKNFAQQKFSEMRAMAREGDYSIRLFGLLGGSAMIVVSGFGLVGLFLTLQFIPAIVEFYTLLMGFIIVTLEAGRQVFFLTKFLHSIHTYALFLKFVWGRGCLYFVAGSLELTQSGLFDKIVGLYMCIVGVMYIIVGRRVSGKLDTLRSALFNEQTLLHEFNQADTDRSGSLSLEQFRGLTDKLHLGMTRSELESAFLIVDKDDSDRLTFDEFKNWWASTTPPQQPASLV